jgi:hypothetical protein
MNPKNTLASDDSIEVSSGNDAAETFNYRKYGAKAPSKLDIKISN